MKTINTNIVWHNAREELPEKSGLYLSVTPSGTFGNIAYSAKHGRFNFYDYNDPNGPCEKDIYPTIFWAEVPEVFSWENLEYYRQ